MTSSSSSSGHGGLRGIQRDGKSPLRGEPKEKAMAELMWEYLLKECEDETALLAMIREQPEIPKSPRILRMVLLRQLEALISRNKFNERTVAVLWLLGDQTVHKLGNAIATSFDPAMTSRTTYSRPPQDLVTGVMLEAALRTEGGSRGKEEEIEEEEEEEGGVSRLQELAEKQLGERVVDSEGKRREGEAEEVGGEVFENALQKARLEICRLREDMKDKKKMMADNKFSVDKLVDMAEAFLGHSWEELGPTTLENTAMALLEGTYVPSSSLTIGLEAVAGFQGKEKWGPTESSARIVVNDVATNDVAADDVANVAGVRDGGGRQEVMRDSLSTEDEVGNEAQAGVGAEVAEDGRGKLPGVTEKEIDGYARQFKKRKLTEEGAGATRRSDEKSADVRSSGVAETISCPVAERIGEHSVPDDDPIKRDPLFQRGGTERGQVTGSPVAAADASATVEGFRGPSSSGLDDASAIIECLRAPSGLDSQIVTPVPDRDHDLDFVGLAELMAAYPDSRGCLHRKCLFLGVGVGVGMGQTRGDEAGPRVELVSSRTRGDDCERRGSSSAELANAEHGESRRMLPQEWSKSLPLKTADSTRGEDGSGGICRGDLQDGLHPGVGETAVDPAKPMAVHSSNEGEQERADEIQRVMYEALGAQKVCMRLAEPQQLKRNSEEGGAGEGLEEKEGDQCGLGRTQRGSHITDEDQTVDGHNVKRIVHYGETLDDARSRDRGGDRAAQLLRSEAMEVSTGNKIAPESHIAKARKESSRCRGNMEPAEVVTEGALSPSVFATGAVMSHRDPVADNAALCVSPRGRREESGAGQHQADEYVGEGVAAMMGVGIITELRRSRQALHAKVVDPLPDALILGEKAIQVVLAREQARSDCANRISEVTKQRITPTRASRYTRGSGVDCAADLCSDDETQKNESEAGGKEAGTDAAPACRASAECVVRDVRSGRCDGKDESRRRKSAGLGSDFEKEGLGAADEKGRANHAESSRSGAVRGAAHKEWVACERHGNGHEKSLGEPTVDDIVDSGSDDCGGRKTSDGKFRHKGVRLLERHPSARAQKWTEDEEWDMQDILNPPVRLPEVPQKKYTPLLRAREDRQPPPRTGPGGRRVKVKFSEEETDALKEGVARYGVGNWTMILAQNPHVFTLRTATDLKDKWRNLSKAGVV